MKLKGPIVTLVAVLALGLVLLLVNRTQSPVAAAAAAPAPPPAAEAPPAEPAAEAVQTVYTGRSDPRAVTVAIAVDGDQAAAYVCDGKKIEAWLEGTVTGGQILLEGENGARLTGTVAGDDVSGTVWAGDDKKWQFTATTAAPPAGLYRAQSEDGSSRIGWIVLPDGEQVGVVSRSGERSPAPRLNQRERTAVIDGAQVVAVRVRV
jgi:hypothetical protein